MLERIVPPLVGAARRLRDSQTVDRLVRGRAWIGLVGLLLIGLVGLNVSLLKLNAAAGRNAEWAKKLRIENADLRARVSRLGSAGRIQSAGAQLGLVMPAAADIHYLTANPARDARQAARRASFTPLWSTDDLVSATSDPVPVAPVIAAPAAVTPTTATGTTGATGTSTVTAPAPAPAATQQPATGATGTQPAAQQPSTGATVP